MAFLTPDISTGVRAAHEPHRLWPDLAASLPRYEPRGIKAEERRKLTLNGLHCPAHIMGRKTAIVRLLDGSLGIIPSAASECNTYFCVSNRKRRQKHETGGRKKRHNSTSSKEH